MKVDIVDARAHVLDIAARARAAARQVSRLSPEVKTGALLQLAAVLRARAGLLGAENEKDLKAGEGNGLSEAMLDRLELTQERVESMAMAVEEIAAATDPVGEVVSQWTRPGGFEVGQVRIPLGVIGIIYESRPNVTADASALCFKAGNAAILRGGSEALYSNLAIGECIREAFVRADVTPDAVQLIETTDRRAVGELLRMNEFVDVIIPRGGKALIRRVVEESTIPVIKHFEGICHTFVHRDADQEMALEIVLNGKVQRPGTCNALETLLVDAEIAEDFVPKVVTELKSEGVRIRGCSRTASLAPVDQAAEEDDYRREYLALECNIRVVDDLESATPSHRGLRIQTHGRDRHRVVQSRTGFRPAGRFLIGHGQRQFASGRRRCLRTGGGDRHQHGQIARLRSHGGPRVNHQKIRRIRTRSPSGVTPRAHLSSPALLTGRTHVSPDYARDLNSSEMWPQTKGRSSLI